MRVLFDQGTPVPLRRSFAEGEVDTVSELGWSTLSNGDLLRRAEAQYDVLVTTDQNLRFQQNLSGRRLAIFVLPTTSWPVIRPLAQSIAAAVSALSAGDYLEFQLPS